MNNNTISPHRAIFWLVLTIVAVQMLVMVPVKKAYSEDAIVVAVDGLSFCLLWEALFGIDCEDEGASDPYLKSNLESAIEDFYPTMLDNLDIRTLDWTRDIGDTVDAINKLRKLLSDINEETYYDPDKKMIVVSHSWGTFVAFEALLYGPLTSESDPIFCDLFINLSSPVGHPFLHIYSCPLDLLVADFVDAAKAGVAESIEDNNGPSYVVELINYWAWGDLISWPLKGIVDFSEDIKVDCSCFLCRCYYDPTVSILELPYTRELHEYTSLKEVSPESACGVSVRSLVVNKIVDTIGFDTTHPRAVGFSHNDAINTNIHVTFSEGMDDSTFTNSTVTVSGSSSGNHSCTFSFNQSTYELTIDPINDFIYDETVTVMIGTGVTDLEGNDLFAPYQFSFKIGSQTWHIISASSTSHGDIDPSGGVLVQQGGSQTFTASANSGYEVDKWYLDGSIDQTGENSYTISNVQDNHSLLVTFKPSGSSYEITIKSPNGGETYERGKVIRINWEWMGHIGENVKIELYKGGALNSVIKASWSNTGHYSWRIPDDQILGSDYRIRISSLSSSDYDDSDGDFEIKEYVPVPDVIEISSLDDLRGMSENWGDSQHPRDGYYVLTQDIEASDTEFWNGGLGFKPIGTGYSDYFRGVFDGQGHKIIGLEIDRPEESLVGLFSVLMYEHAVDRGVVKNLTLERGRIIGKGSVGALVGECAGTVINCHSSAEVRGARVDPRDEIGGLVGDNTQTGVLRNCSTYQLNDESEITAYEDTDEVGGLVGQNSGTIEWCFSTLRRVRGHHYRVGGIAGSNWGIIRECYADISSEVKGVHYVGGVTGDNHGTVSDCYSASPIDGDSGGNVGGVVGYNDGGIITRCYAAGTVNVYDGGGLVGKCYGAISDSFWDTEATGVPSDRPVGSGSCTVTNCYGKTTAEMMQQSKYEAAGWDFENVWAIDEGVTRAKLRGVVLCLSPPDGLLASTGERDGVHLSWDPVTCEMNGSSYEAAYCIYRSDSEVDPIACNEDAAKTALGDVCQTSLEFLDDTAVPEVTYCYWVKAASTANGAGESDFSNYAMGSRDYPPLDVPTGVVATDDMTGFVLVEWNTVTNANYYRVYRADSEEGTKTPLGEWQSVLSFTDYTVIPEIVYYYWVTASINQEGERESNFGGPDSGTCFTTPDNIAPSVSFSASPDLPIETQNIRIDVSASDDNILDRIVLHWDDGGEHTHPWNNINSGSYDDFHDIGSYSADQQIEVWAEAWDESENRAESNHKIITVQPETVSVPDSPTGPLFLHVDQNDVFTTGGSSSNLDDHSIEYQFDWDGTQSDWGSDTQSNSWSSEGYYFVKAHARCEIHTNRVSDWSNPFIVTIVDSEFVCNDNIDNDNDGLTDCADPDCEGLACDDGDPCTGDDICSGESCMGTPMSCDDENECTDDSCENGKCVNQCNATSPDDPCCADSECVDYPACPSASDYYVCSTGDDGNDCTSPNSPCATIQGAINKANGLETNPVTIHVVAGTYNENIEMDDFESLRGGYNSDWQRWDFDNDGLEPTSEYETIIDADSNGSCIILDSLTSEILFIDGLKIQNGNANGNGGGIRNSFSSPIIRNCVFYKNSADGHYGGGIYNNNSSPTISNCIFLENRSETGGGIMNHSNSAPTINNCIFSKNSVTHVGGGIYNYFYSSPVITNCTFSGNSSDRYGGGISNFVNSSPYLINCILWGNTAQLGPKEIDNKNDSYPTLAYCDIDQDGYEGSDENIRLDPLFVDPTNNDFHLQCTSPCIDVGDPIEKLTSDYNSGGTIVYVDSVTNISVGDTVWITDGINTEYDIVESITETEIVVENGFTNSYLIDDNSYIFTTTSDFRNEPEDNGDRINIGAYGNAPEAAVKCCINDADCDDGLFCNGAETCVDGTCQPGTNPCPDDRLYCNGIEGCNEVNDTCTHSGNPCPANCSCDEGNDSCNCTTTSIPECETDKDCDDGVYCNGTERCVRKKCKSGSDPCPDDRLFCNGEEGCNEDKDECIHSGDSCAPEDLICDEDNDVCVDCLIDDDCDDGLYCNGEETCIDNACQTGSNPCLPGEECDEENDRCLPTIAPLSFILTPSSALRSHLIPLPLFMLIVSDDPGTKFDRTSTEVSFDVALTPPLTLVLSEDLIFTFSLILPSGLGVSGSSEVVVTVTTNEGEGTATLTLVMLPFILDEEK